MAGLIRTVALILTVAACSRPATSDSVTGTYVMNHGKAHDTLIVYPSGEYARRYAAPGAAIVVDSGRWTWDTINGEQFLTFEKFVPRWMSELYPNVPSTPGFWPARPERRSGGAVEIPVERDIGWAYVRLQP